MEGVQILNQFEVVTEPAFSWSNFWIGLVVGAGIGLVIAISFGISEGDWCTFLFALAISVPILGCVLGFISGHLMASLLSAKPDTKYQSVKK